MNLKQYLEENKIQKKFFAKRAGIPSSHLSSVISGKRKVSSRIAWKIQALTNGKVNRATIRPDIFLKPEWYDELEQNSSGCLGCAFCGKKLSS